jgi:hypothetical protein
MDKHALVIMSNVVEGHHDEVDRLFVQHLADMSSQDGFGTARLFKLEGSIKQSCPFNLFSIYDVSQLDVAMASRRAERERGAKDPAEMRRRMLSNALEPERVVGWFREIAMT